MTEFEPIGFKNEMTDNTVAEFIRVLNGIQHETRSAAFDKWEQGDIMGYLYAIRAVIEDMVEDGEFSKDQVNVTWLQLEQIFSEARWKE